MVTLPPHPLARNKAIAKRGRQRITQPGHYAVPEQVPAVNVPSEHDEAVHVNPVLPVWVHVVPLARIAVQPPALAALASITVLASQGSAAHTQTHIAQ